MVPRKILIMTVTSLFMILPALSGFIGISREEEVIVEAEVLLSRSGVHAGEVFKLAVKLKINPAWHINANPVSDEFLIPTTLAINGNENIKTLGLFYPLPEKGKFEYSEVELEIYSGQVILGALLQSPQDLSPGLLKMKGKVSYQACNDRFCLPPKTLELEIPVKILPASEPGEEVNQDIFSMMEFKTGESF